MNRQKLTPRVDREREREPSGNSDTGSAFAFRIATHTFAGLASGVHYIKPILVVHNERKRPVASLPQFSAMFGPLNQLSRIGRAARQLRN